MVISSGGTMITVYHFLFDITIMNGFLLLRHFVRLVKMSLTEFCVKLASQVIGHNCIQQRPCQRPIAIPSMLLRHFPNKVNADILQREEGVIVLSVLAQNVREWTVAGTVGVRLMALPYRRHHNRLFCCDTPTSIDNTAISH